MRVRRLVGAAVVALLGSVVSLTAAPAGATTGRAGPPAATGQAEPPATPGQAGPPATPGQAEPHVLDEETRGTEVLDKHPELVSKVARINSFTESKTKKLLEDRSVRVDQSGKIYFVEPAPEPAQPGATVDPQPGPYPYPQTFALHSKPGSSRTIYLDFNGETISGTFWAADDAGSYTALPYDKDGNGATFSSAEQDDIQYIWQRVAEDYAPFDVDVTTQDPGAAKIDRTSEADAEYGTRVLVTNSPSSDVTTVSTTGVAYIGAFNQYPTATDPTTHNQMQPAWAFPAGLSYNPKWIAEVVSHELGHNVGLSHDGGGGDGEYYAGHGVWAPIMGSAYNRPMSQWSKGEYTDPSNTEDDLAVMSTYGLATRPDDHTSNLATATPLTSTASGIVTSGYDEDLFKYTATATGPVTFNADPAPNGPNLDIVLSLYSATSTLLAQDNPQVQSVDATSGLSADATASGLSASVTYNVVAGTSYYLQVRPSNHLTPSTGYSTYGSLGQYQVSVGGGTGSCTGSDTFEPNDSAGSAAVATNGVAMASRICRGNDDYFSVEAVAGQLISASLSFTNAQGDLDLSLQAPSGYVQATSATGGDVEAISETAYETGLYTARITGASGAANTYSLTMSSPTCPADDAYEENDTFDQASYMGYGDTRAGIVCAGDPDFWGFYATAGDTVDVDVRFLHRFGDINVALLDQAGNQLAASNSADDDETLSYTAAADGYFEVRVAGAPGVVNTYTVMVTNRSYTSVPAAPTEVTASAAFSSATVNWSAPSDGGAAIKGYVVTPFVGTTAQTPVNVAATATSQVITGLTNGTAYTFKVAAMNVIGTGALSAASNPVTPGPMATVPGAPTGVSAVVGSGSATVNWSPPASNGGSAITGYVVTPFIGTTPQTPTNVTGTGTSKVVTGLAPGTTYTFQVAAVNAIGTGAPSAPSNSVTTPTTVPSAPAYSYAVAGNASATVSWYIAPPDGGSPITGYVVTPYVGTTAQTARSFNSTATSQVVTGLTNGTAYTFKVAAVNAVGTGAQSGASNAVTPTAPATVPGAPTGVSAVAGDASATVNWSAPASNGGSAVTGYVVTPYIGATAQTAVNVAGTGTSKVVTGLTNGTAYTFKVAAVNAVGTGAQSGASNAVTPTAVAVAPYAPFASWSAFVTRQYTDVTAKAPTSSELSYWSTALANASVTKGDLIEALRRGTDNTANVDPTARLYRAFLGRAPDAGGLRYWINRRRSGTLRLVGMADYFAASNEFKTKYGTLTNREFVTRIYTDVLGRAADQAGVDYWTQQLDLNRRTRGGVMVGFSESSEYKRKQAENTDVAVAYIFLMGRTATATETTDWVTRQRAGTTQATLATELLNSTAYASHITG